MKTIRILFAGVMLLLVSALPIKSSAQASLDSYFNIDWQFNFPMGNKFSNVASGWGMNFEGGYYVKENLAVGAFINFHTNNEYFLRRTIALTPTLSLNTDQQHQMFQLPFGALVKYRFVEADFQPYVALKLGACYTQFTNYYYIFESSVNTWGFYASPEIGFNYFPWANGVGFHAAIYYSFATNKCNLMSYDQSSLNNIGIRVGLAF